MEAWRGSRVQTLSPSCHPCMQSCACRLLDCTGLRTHAADSAPAPPPACHRSTMQLRTGDTIVRRLAEELQPRWVVFLTDVAGIFDRPPSEAGAQLLEQVTVATQGPGFEAATSMSGGLGAPGSGIAGAVQEAVVHGYLSGGNGGNSGSGIAGGVRIGGAVHGDTTGGMASKVEEAAAICRLGIPVVVAAAGSAAGAAACLTGPGSGPGDCPLSGCTVVRCKPR